MNLYRLQQVSWNCIHFCGAETVEDINRSLSNLNFVVRCTEERSLSTKHDVLKAVAHALSFPDYFGYNLDALDECLRDLDWLPESSGYVLLFKGSKKLWEDNPMIAMALVRSWLFCAEDWSQENIPFHLVFSDMEDSYQQANRK